MIADSSMVMEDLLELIEEENTAAESERDVASDERDVASDERDDARDERDYASDERDVVEKKLKDLRKKIVKFEDQAHCIISDVSPKETSDRSHATEALHTENGGRLGIKTGTPQSLMHVKCECGKELFIDGPGWSIDFQGPVVFKCSCGREESISIDDLSPRSLCTACEMPDNPLCRICSRPICAECEADDPNNPPCSTCERNRPMREPV